MVNVECEPKIADLYGKETTRFFHLFSLTLSIPLLFLGRECCQHCGDDCFYFRISFVFFCASDFFFFLYFGARAIRQQCQLYFFFSEKKPDAPLLLPQQGKTISTKKSHKFSNVLGIGAVFFFSPFPFCFLLLCSPSGSTRCYGILLTQQTLFPHEKTFNKNK